MSDLVLPGDKDFLIIGQQMADGPGVVLLTGEPLRVHMREIASLKSGATILLTIDLAAGYTKVRARDFQHAMEMLRAGT